ncbi:MAG: hypothetical protein MR868_10360 [Lachnospiraceae bacterium]|nr:hypothetical protein [Lachnospiraceae bacterium]
MDEKTFYSLMERIERSNAGQEKYARRQYRMSQITALASILILAVVIYTASILIPKINVTYQNMQLILEDMQVITSELADADLNRAIQNLSEVIEPLAQVFGRFR